VGTRPSQRKPSPLWSRTALQVCHHYTIEGLLHNLFRVAHIYLICSVIARTTALVLELEAKCVARDVVLIAHGDVLQILQTWFLDVDARHHRHFAHLSTGEARMVWGGLVRTQLEE
jgi:hypothetical protein